MYDCLVSVRPMEILHACKWKENSIDWTSLVVVSGINSYVHVDVYIQIHIHLLIDIGTLPSEAKGEYLIIMLTEQHIYFHIKCVRDVRFSKNHSMSGRNIYHNEYTWLSTLTDASHLNETQHIYVP